MVAQKSLCMLIIAVASQNCFSAETASDPYQGLKFYYGDNHFHSGFSGENTSDAHPLEAFKNAAERARKLGSDTARGGDGTSELGGYFLFMSDHVHFIPTRNDMTEEKYQIMRKESNDSQLELAWLPYTLTIFPGGELTGLARNLKVVPPWDDKFGHMNIFNLTSISQFDENKLLTNIRGTDAMDKLAEHSNVVGQFNHPGYSNEPRTGDDANSLYPYTKERDKVFKFFEVTDGGDYKNWNQGVAQYNLCLQHGYHISPVVGSDIHNTKDALLFRTDAKKIARTVIIAEATNNKNHEQRRNTLLSAVYAGRVYATENSNLHIKTSLNNHTMGHQFDQIPSHLTFNVRVEDIGKEEIKTVELVQNQKCSVQDKDVVSEDQCTKRIKLWSSDSDNENVFYNNHSAMNATFDIDTKELSNLKYIYLKVTEKDGERALTTPFFFK